MKKFVRTINTVNFDLPNGISKNVYYEYFNEVHHADFNSGIGILIRDEDDFFKVYDISFFE